jgi:hypothetical protein
VRKAFANAITAAAERAGGFRGLLIGNDAPATNRSTTIIARLIFFVHMPNSNLNPTAEKRSLGKGIVRSLQRATSAPERQLC